MEKKHKSILEGRRAVNSRNVLTYGNVQFALSKSFGIKKKAAEMLQCSYGKLNEFIKQNPELEQFAIESNNIIGDIAEAKLNESIQKGNMTSIRFWLQTKGKERGYNTRMEHTGKDGEDLFKPTDDEHRQNFEQLMARVKKDTATDKESPEGTVH
jgi:hypothetical protein